MLKIFKYFYLSKNGKWCRKMVKCPRCGSESVKTLKSWDTKSPKSKHTLKVSMVLCQNCGKKFRIGEAIIQTIQ
jgi:transcription elongation factor Elf1